MTPVSRVFVIFSGRTNEEKGSMELIDGKYGPKKRPQDLAISMCIDWDNYHFVKYEIVEGNKGDGDTKEEPESYKEEQRKLHIHTRVEPTLSTSILLDLLWFTHNWIHVDTLPNTSLARKCKILIKGYQLTCSNCQRTVALMR